MTTKGPFDEHTEPAFDDEQESPTESVARELLTQLAGHAASRHIASEFADFDALSSNTGDATRPVQPVALDTSEATRVVPAPDDHTRPLDAPLDAVSLSLGDMTSDGLERLHRDHAAPDPAGDFEVEVTSPGLIPAAKTGADALKEKRGDIAQLLASIAPFLWSLEAAEKWVRDHASGDPEGENHARSLALLARVLGQLQARIDEAAKQIR